MTSRWTEKCCGLGVYSLSGYGVVNNRNDSNVSFLKNKKLSRYRLSLFSNYRIVSLSPSALCHKCEIKCREMKYFFDFLLFLLFYSVCIPIASHQNSFSSPTSAIIVDEGRNRLISSIGILLISISC